MIVVLDTNALHSDVYATGANAETLFTAAAAGRFEVWVPSVVFEELVRQFSERFKKVASAYGKSAYDARSLGLPMPPELPDEAETVGAYRGRLERILDREGVKVVGPPDGAGVIAEWVAQRRKPIPGTGRGTVDAQIWLTALDAAEDDQVVLLAKNPEDFADESNHGELHPTLKQDIEDCGLEEEAIELVETIFEFNQQHIESDELALGEARTLLADDDRRGRLAVEIADAVEWFPLAAESDDWRTALGTDYDSASLVAFDVEGLTLLRADAASSGSYLSLIAYGDATVDADLWIADAVQLEEDSPLAVGEIDLEAPMASAGGAVPARLAVEVLLKDGQPFVSIEEVAPVSNEDVEALLESWSKLNPGAALELVRPEFDASGEQRATRAHPGSVQSFEFRPGGIYARVEFLVDYDNPIDAEDDEYLANNATEFSLLVKVSEPDLDGLRLGEVTAVADPLVR